MKPETYNQLSKIKHDTTSRVNKDVTFDDSVKLLIDAYENSHKHEVPA